MGTSALFVSTLNEIDGLRALWGQIPLKEFKECYALDGGSTDGSLDFFRQHNIPIIHSVKKGEIFNVGASVTECSELVFFAPDGNENPADILLLLDTLRQGYDQVIGSRFMQASRNEEDGKLFKWRKWANQAFTWTVRLLWGGKLTDTINGFRAVRKEAVQAMKLEPTGFDIEFQMSIRGLKLKQRICELPTIEGDRLGGQSTAVSLPTGLLMLKRVTRELFLGKRFKEQKVSKKNLDIEWPDSRQRVHD